MLAVEVAELVPSCRARRRGDVAVFSGAPFFGRFAYNAVPSSGAELVQIRNHYGGHARRLVLRKEGIPYVSRQSKATKLLKTRSRVRNRTKQSQFRTLDAYKSRQARPIWAGHSGECRRHEARPSRQGCFCYFLSSLLTRQPQWFAVERRVFGSLMMNRSIGKIWAWLRTSCDLGEKAGTLDLEIREQD